MKKQILSKLALTLLAVTICSYSASAQLGNLKNKVKDKVKDTKNDAGSAADPYTLNKDKGDKAFEEKRWDDAKKAYESAAASTTSDYMKSSVQSKADEAAENSKKCSEKISSFNKFYSDKKYADALKIWDGGAMSFNVQEKCICEDKMKQQAEDCRKQLGQQKADNEEKQLNEAQAMLTQMEDSKYKCSNVEADNGVSGPMHTKQMKKFVFSKTEIVKGQENEANFTNTFNVEDNIYSRVYIDKSIINEAKSVGECNNGMPTYFIRWTFDDGATKLPEWLNVNIHNVLRGSDDGIYKWTTWQPAVSWSAGDLTEHSTETMYFVKYMKNLPVGKHKIKMELVYDIPADYNNGYSDYKYTTKFGPERVMASGEFTVNVTEAGRKQLYKKVCGMYKKEIENYNKAAVTLIPNANELVKGSKGIDWNKFTLLKVVSDYNDWAYKKNVYGVVLSRSYAAGAYLLNKEDNFIYYSTVSYYQENISSGGSKYSATSASVEEQNIEYTRNYDSFCKECIGK